MARLTKADFAAQTKAGKLEAARAEYAALKAQREAQEKAAAAHAAAVQPAPAAASEEQLFGGFSFDELPSWKRVLVGCVLSIAAMVGTGYGVAAAAGYVLGGIALLSVSATLAMMMSFTVWVIALYTGWKLGGWAAGKVFSSVVMPDGLAARSAASLRNKMSEMLDSSRNVISAPFSGAHVKTGAA